MERSRAPSSALGLPARLASAAARARVQPGWAVAAGAVLATAVAYALLGRLVHGPSVFGDELIYMEAARSLADDGAAFVRDDPYRFGPLYPGVLAPLVRLASSSATAYDLIKLANAVLFALAAFPVYLLARRLLPTGWSAVVAALSIAVPSSVYTGLVLTESLAYLAASWALLATVLVLERPSIARQLAALASIAVATAVRPQLAVLAAALILALALRWALAPSGSRPGRLTLRRLWPTVVLVAGAAVAAAATVVGGSSPAAGLGAYGSLWQSYDPVDVARWSWYTLAELTLYLAVVPVVVAPAAVATLAQWGRAGSSAHAAFVSLFVSATGVMVVLVGAFSTTSFGEGRLRDRYLFYLVPLWLVLLAVWLHARRPVGRISLAAGAGLALLLMASLPPSFLVRDGARQLDGVATALWVEVRELADGRAGGLRLALVAAALAASLAVLLVPPRARALLVVPLAAAFVANAALVWDQRIADADRQVFQARTARFESWVDREVPHGTTVTTLYVSSERCASVREAFLFTEFFNARVGAGAHVGGASSNSVPSHEVHVAGGGEVVESSGRPLVADVVLAPPGVQLRGRSLAEGTAARLVLWRVDGPVSIVGAGSDEELLALACPGASSVAATS